MIENCDKGIESQKARNEESFDFEKKRDIKYFQKTLDKIMPRVEVESLDVEPKDLKEQGQQLVRRHPTSKARVNEQVWVIKED